MKREALLTLLCAVLFIAVVVMALWGCGCKKKASKEGFTTKEAAPKEEPALSPQEEELFNDIQTGQLNDEDIQKMVESGKITEKMVEKFLAYLDTMAPGDEGKASAPATPTRTPKLPPAEEGFELEGFTGKAFASVK
jgi:hypothetical protein